MIFIASAMLIIFVIHFAPSASSSGSGNREGEGVHGHLVLGDRVDADLRATSSEDGRQEFRKSNTRAPKASVAGQLLCLDVFRRWVEAHIIRLLLLGALFNLLLLGAMER